jgi:hypothetical protein
VSRTIAAAERCHQYIPRLVTIWTVSGSIDHAVIQASEANLRKFLEGRNNATAQSIKTIESELIVR